MPEMSLSVNGALAEIVISIPPQNRLTVQSVDELDAIVDQIEVGDIRAVLIRAEGQDFCCGAHTDEWPTMTDRQRHEYFSKVMRVLNRFEALPVPTVAAVQGLAASLGVEIAVRADVIFAGKSARFEHAEAAVGIATMIGGVYRMAERAGRSKSIEWAYTGEQTPADELERFGIVNRVVEDKDLLRSAREFAARVSKGATQALNAHKQLLRIWANSGTATADDATLSVVLPLFNKHDAQVGIRAAAEARKSGHSEQKPDFTGE